MKLTRASIAEGEVLAPSSEGDGVVEDVHPRWGRSVVDKPSHRISVGTYERIVSTGHLSSEEYSIST